MSTLCGNGVQVHIKGYIQVRSVRLIKARFEDNLFGIILYLLHQALSRRKWSDAFELICNNPPPAEEEMVSLLPGLRVMKREHPDLFKVCETILYQASGVVDESQLHKCASPQPDEPRASKTIQQPESNLLRVDGPPSFAKRLDGMKGLYYHMKDKEEQQQERSQAITILTPALLAFLYRPGGAFFRVSARRWVDWCDAQEAAAHKGAGPVTSETSSCDGTRPSRTSSGLLQQPVDSANLKRQRIIST